MAFRSAMTLGTAVHRRCMGGGAVSPGPVMGRVGGMRIQPAAHLHAAVGAWAGRATGATTVTCVRGFASSPLASDAREQAEGGSVHDLSSLAGRHLPDLFALTSAEIDGLLSLSLALKRLYTSDRGAVYQPLRGRTMSMIFQKRSTRTRVSTETGMAKLGGHALFLSTDDIQLGKNESVADTARVLARFNDVILARVYGHAIIQDLCAHSAVPVINALSDTHHPLQGLADLMTLKERFGTVAGLNIAWVGDGNNIAHTFLSAVASMGYNLAVATPPGYECDPTVVSQAQAATAACKWRDGSGAGTMAQIRLTHDPAAAVKDADVIVTDTWISMGQEEEAAKRLKAFSGYQVTEAMAAAGGAKPGWVFLHCLPRKPQEVDDAVFYSPQRSLVFQEAENRQWTVMAVVLAQLLGRVTVPGPCRA